MGQPAEHETTRRRVDESLAGGAQSLVVSTEPPVLTEPCERPLHYHRRGSTHGRLLGRAVIVARRTIRCASLVRRHVAPIHHVVEEDVERPPLASRDSVRSTSYRYLCSPDLPINARHEGIARQPPPRARARLPDLEYPQCAPWARSTRPPLSTSTWRLRPLTRFAPS